MEDSPPLISGFEAFEDGPDAPFYRSRARNISAQETWGAIHEALVRQLKELNREAARGPVRITPERLRKWHRVLFRKDFPHSAGVFRKELTHFPVTYIEDGIRVRLQGDGAAPENIEVELKRACEEFGEAIDRAVRAGGRIRLSDAALVAARLYAKVLAVHPFEDGNARTAFIALQAALLSQGVWMVHFGGDVQAHDDHLGWALRPDAKRDYQPLANLLAERVRTSAAGPDWGTIEP